MPTAASPPSRLGLELELVVADRAAAEVEDDGVDRELGDAWRAAAGAREHVADAPRGRAGLDDVEPERLERVDRVGRGQAQPGRRASRRARGAEQRPRAVGPRLLVLVAGRNADASAGPRAGP